MIDFTQMIGPQLVEAYNEMAATATDLGLTTVTPVKRFSGIEAGRRRCAALHALVQDAAADKQLPNRGTDAKPEQGSGVTTEAAPQAASEAPAPEAGGEEETDDMAKKRKAGRKPERKAGAARRTEGPTLASLTEEYNKMVPGAKRAGVAWAKHHTSLFESKDKAKVQLKRLADAVKKAG